MEYHNFSSENSIEYSATTECTFLELLSYPNLPDIHQTEGTLDDTSLPGWFTKDLNLPSLATQSGQPPSGGLRLLIAAGDWDKEKGYSVLPFRKASFDVINGRLGLPAQFIVLLASKPLVPRLAQAFSFSTYRQMKGPAITCAGIVIKLPFYYPVGFQLALSYDKESKVTYGLLLRQSDNNIIPPLLRRLDSQKSHCQQPLLMAVLSIEHVVDFCNERLEECSANLLRLEPGMGHHEFPSMPRGNPLELDFLAATRTLNSITNKVGVDIARLGSTLLALDNILAWGKDIEQVNSTECGFPKGSSTGLEWSQVMDEKIAYLADTCRILLLGAEYLQKRAQTLIQVVYQFMAQRDAKVNIALAESSAVIAKASKEDSMVIKSIAIESKKDSSAMKIVAVLGMFFLPGTFIAAIFAMPVFNWDDNNAPIIKTGFKYYWATALPLTAVVLVSWALAVLLPWRTWLLNLAVSRRSDRSV